MTAVVTHAAGKIKVWEIWNEPTVPGYWQGTNQQMLRLAQDAYGIIKAIDPNALVTTPAPSTGINGVANWMGPYLALGGGNTPTSSAFTDITGARRRESIPSPRPSSPW